MSYRGPSIPLPLPSATKTLLLVNVAVFLVNMLLFGRLTQWFAFSWPGLFDGFGLGLLRVVSYQFTHSFQDVMHVLTNMISLWVFGPMVESRLGRAGTLRLYLWGGMAGALGHLAVASLLGTAAVPLVGASGACYALLVFAACTAPQAQIVFFIVQMPLWGLAALLVGIGVYSTWVELATGYQGGVSHSAHLGGALLGFVAWRLRLFASWSEYAPDRPGLGQRLLQAWRRRRTAGAQRAAEQQELQLDAILAKVKEHGIGALLPAERRLLDRISRQKQGHGR
ncbi:MAG: rhomboid family intramembrane serine protease [Planctomycetes bacterium]|nr:rhomboid family intramembrane serine protease [Planctomycetota bacterium]